MNTDNHEIFLTHLLKNAEEVLILVDSKLNVAYCSDSFLRILGAHLVDDVRNKSVLDVYKQLAYGKFFTELANMLALAVGQDETSHHDIIIEKNGSNDQRAYRVTNTPMLDKTVNGVIITWDDITDITEAKNKAEAASRSKSNFLATMSHEIRTPLNAILGIAQIQMQKNDIPDEYYDAFEKINSSGSSLLGIINDILDLSKIETGKLELTPSAYDLPSLINDALQLNIVRIGSKPIDFILDLDENLPSGLYGDELRLKQILNNLLSNAVKYTQSGHIKLTVKSRDYEAGNETEYRAEDEIRLVFEVEDTGQGMKPEDTQQLFMQYAHFNVNANRDTEGTGLGLHITKQLVDMMGGTISADSRYGEGSVFTVEVTQKITEPAPIGEETALRLSSFSYNDTRMKNRRKTSRSAIPYGKVPAADPVPAKNPAGEAKRTVTDTRDTIKSGKQRKTKVRKPYSMHRFIVFSVTLFILIILLGSVTFYLSMRQIIRVNNGNELIGLLDVKRLELENYVNGEISMVLKLADSPLIKRYFENPDNTEIERLAFEEMRSYRQAFSEHSIFWVNDIDRMFYSDDNESYYVDADDPANYWYNMTLYNTKVYNFNINYNPDIKVTKLWINAPVFNEYGYPIGMVGTGMDLNTFIDDLYRDIEDRIELFFFNSSSEITGARDIRLVERKISIIDVITRAYPIAKSLMPDEIQTYDVADGKIAVCSIPVLEWYAVVYMPDSLDDFNNTLTVFFLVVIPILAVIFIIFNIFIARLLKPLRRTMIDLEAANKAKSDFLAMMSHEIRTPINAVIGITQIQLQKRSLPDEYIDVLDKIYSSGNTLLGIVNDVLDLSRIETGKMELAPVDYDLPSLINDTVQLNIARIGPKPIDLIVDADENLPARMFGDELRLKQILNNLLSNAIKYTEKGHVRLSVSHMTLYEESAETSSRDLDTINSTDEIYLTFKVEDTGQGMKPEDVERLFTEYTRFNTGANRATEGTGIGLVITKSLVEMMEGTIDVESEYGRGSIFTVTVKQAKVECPLIGADTAKRLREFTFKSIDSAAEMQHSYVPMPYGKVLVVDDTDMNLYVVEGLLAPYRLQVETANSGFETIDKIKSGCEYDIIFMDHMMPKMDGVETTLKLREMGYTGKIVALTANAIVGSEKMFRKNGFDGFVAKPIDIKKLDEVLHEFIARSYPDEAAKYQDGSVSNSNSNSNSSNKETADPKLLKIFCRDAEGAVKTLTETLQNGDVKLFTTSAHAMKSVLKLIGEEEASKLALRLEEAGQRDDKEYINNNAPGFIKLLEETITKLRPEEKSTGGDGTADDTGLLGRQLELVKAACEAYDDESAYAALDRLTQETWSAKTSAALEAIRDALYLDSDFDKAVALINELL